jgi:hypothetical protein
MDAQRRGIDKPPSTWTTKAVLSKATGSPAGSPRDNQLMLTPRLSDARKISGMSRTAPACSATVLRKSSTFRTAWLHFSLRAPFAQRRRCAFAAVCKTTPPRIKASDGDARAKASALRRSDCGRKSSDGSGLSSCYCYQWTLEYVYEHIRVITNSDRRRS